LDILQVCVAHTKTKNRSYQYIQGTAQQCVDRSAFDCHLWGCLKPLVFSAANENEETLHQLIFNICQTLQNRPREF
jgi:hypothetical protein